MVVAGEASGDHHAADLVRSLQVLSPGLRFSGMGGAALAAAGQEVPAEYLDGAADALTFEELRLETRVELMTDPESLLPVWLEERQTRAGRGIGLGEPFSFFTEEILTTEFSYPPRP